jgi:hypothetical protein
MKGIVVHHQGKIWRSLEGRTSIGRLAIRVISAVPAKQEGASVGRRIPRPLYFVFSLEGRPFAASKYVTLRKGRRYPHIEHWFIQAEPPQQLELNELQQASVSPVLTTSSAAYPSTQLLSES